MSFLFGWIKINVVVFFVEVYGVVVFYLFGVCFFCVFIIVIVFISMVFMF